MSPDLRRDIRDYGLLRALMHHYGIRHKDGYKPIGGFSLLESLKWLRHPVVAWRKAQSQTRCDIVALSFLAIVGVCCVCMAIREESTEQEHAREQQAAITLLSESGFYALSAQEWAWCKKMGESECTRESVWDKTPAGVQWHDAYCAALLASVQSDDRSEIERLEALHGEPLNALHLTYLLSAWKQYYDALPSDVRTAVRAVGKQVCISECQDGSFRGAWIPESDGALILIHLYGDEIVKANERRMRESRPSPAKREKLPLPLR